MIHRGEFNGRMNAGDIKAILFDLNGTLCRFAQSREQVLRRAFASIGVEPFFTAADYRACERAHAADANRLDGRRRRCFERLAREDGREPSLGRDLAAAYDRLREYDLEFRDGASALLDRLSGTYPLGLVTNGCPDGKGADVESLSLPAYFDTLVFAGHETPPKPDPEPFRHALDDLGVRPERAVHVGDSLATDVAGASRAGLRAIRLRASAGDAPVRESEPRSGLNSAGETHEAALTVGSLSRLEQLFARETVEPEGSD